MQKEIPLRDGEGFFFYLALLSYQLLSVLDV